ncbi:MAG: hypothetical protein IPM06_21045 [Rhizobiales bacterium]|nr:hypothetical protein [Hyphomicrobiales bacterium]
MTNVPIPERADPLLPDVYADDPDVARLAEVINRLGGQMMSSIDAAVRTRTAPSAAQRERHNARRHLQQAGLHAMAALGFTRKPSAK